MRLKQTIRKMPTSITRSMQRGGSVVATYCGEVTPLPGNPDVVVSHGLYRSDGEGGHGKTANKQRLRQLASLGYSAVMCTVCSDNVKQLTILRDEGWHEAPPFKSRRTGHDIIMFMKPLSSS